MRLEGAPANEPPALSTTIRLEAHTAATVVGMGKQANLELVTLTDGTELPDAGKTKVRSLAADGTLGLPTDTDTVGWFGGSSRPGDIGPAVMVGHVDSLDGPAVFGRPAGLEVGEVVAVDNADGTTVSFVVSSVTQYPNDSFPSDAV